MQVPLLREWQLPVPGELPELRLLLMRTPLILLLAATSVHVLAQEATQTPPPNRPTQVPT